MYKVWFTPDTQHCEQQKYDQSQQTTVLCVSLNWHKTKHLLEVVCNDEISHKLPVLTGRNCNIAFHLISVLIAAGAELQKSPSGRLQDNSTVLPLLVFLVKTDQEVKFFDVGFVVPVEVAVLVVIVIADIWCW